VITGQAHDPDTGIVVEVGPGGGLRDLVLDSRSLRLGGGLARAILNLVDTATARANARARHALGPVDQLGLTVDDRRVAEVEETTPETWRV
jgi:hypothetical protein